MKEEVSRKDARPQTRSVSIAKRGEQGARDCSAIHALRPSIHLQREISGAGCAVPLDMRTRLDREAEDALIVYDRVGNTHWWNVLWMKHWWKLQFSLGITLKLPSFKS